MKKIFSLLIALSLTACFWQKEDTDHSPDADSPASQKEKKINFEEYIPSNSYLFLRSKKADQTASITDFLDGEAIISFFADDLIFAAKDIKNSQQGLFYKEGFPELASTNQDILVTKPDNIKENTTLQDIKKVFPETDDMYLVFLPENYNIPYLSDVLRYVFMYLPLSDDRVLIDGEVVLKGDMQSKTHKKPFQIYKKIAQDDLILYFESFSLQSTEEFVLSLLSNANYKWADFYNQQKNDLRKSLGISWTSDVYSWTKDSFAIMTHKSQVQTPYLTVIFKIESNKKKATDLLKKIDEILNLWVKMDKNFIGKTKRQKPEMYLYSYQFKDVFEDKYNFHNLTFGIYDDEYLVVSTMPNISKIFSNTPLLDSESLLNGDFLMIGYMDRIFTSPFIKDIKKMAIKGIYKTNSVKFEGQISFD